jgi:prepilin-type N-terminal cleavage/methylation domain-containing protein
MLRPHSHRGFTLLEVLISLLILGIGIMAVMELFPHALSQVRLATERIPKAAWANEELSVLRARGVTGEPSQLNWPERMYLESEKEAVLQYNLQPIGMSDTVRPLSQAAAIYALCRVTISVPMPGDRRETFVTYISKY